MEINNFDSRMLKFIGDNFNNFSVSCKMLFGKIKTVHIIIKLMIESVFASKCNFLTSTHQSSAKKQLPLWFLLQVPDFLS